jgi:hypothetical protein
MISKNKIKIKFVDDGFFNSSFEIIIIIISSSSISIIFKKSPDSIFASSW